MDDLKAIFKDYCIIAEDNPTKVNNNIDMEVGGDKALLTNPTIRVKENGSDVTCGHYFKSNIPEKIIFCIDASSEMNRNSFKMRSGSSVTPLELIKKAILFFIDAKSTINKKHSYCICPILNKTTHEPKFHNKRKTIENILRDLTANYPTDSCDLNTLLNQILDILPDAQDPESPFIVRVILIYGRSHIMPSLDQELMECVFKSQHFFMDIFYIHDPVSKNNLCQSIFNFFCGLETHHNSYIYDAMSNPTHLFNHMAQFIAHPLQRSPQDRASYKLPDSSK